MKAPKRITLPRIAMVVAEALAVAWVIAEFGDAAWAWGLAALAAMIAADVAWWWWKRPRAPGRVNLPEILSETEPLVILWIALAVLGTIGSIVLIVVLAQFVSDSPPTGFEYLHGSP